jgi:hypothetical protein
MAQQPGTIDEGREAQFQEMMERFAEIQAKYRGVRGELLAKVRDELMRLKPERKQAKVVTTGMLPSCRACGRTMRETGDGSLVCQNGHTRALAG